jgi:hypothetical protein
MTDVETKASDAAANDELPNGLKVLLFVGEWYQNGNPFRYGMYPVDEENQRWLDNVRTYFGEIGFVLPIKQKNSAAFLKAISADDAEISHDTSSALVAIGIIATEEVLNKQFKYDGGEFYSISEMSPSGLHDDNGWSDDGDIATVVLSSLSPIFSGAEINEILCRGVRLYSGSNAQQIEAAQATDEQIKEVEGLQYVVGYKLAQVAAVIRQHNRLSKAKPTSFLVPGLIPQASVTLLLGNRKVGKSANALELAVTVARRELSWAGFPVTPREGIAVYLAGEDTTEETLARVRQMTGGTTPYTLWIEGGNDLDTILKSLKDQKVALLVVDPARKYFTGDEDGSDAVSGFFTKLEDFARKKNAAVVVTHHLKRYAQPKNASDVANHYRGSGVFLDRPRVTIAMHRNAAGTDTQLAIPVLDGTPLHNFRQSEMFSGVRRLRRDEKTFRHVPIGEATTGTTKEVGQGDTDRILEAARDLLAAGERLTRTGPAALFERKLPQLAGLSRATVRAVVDALVSQGRLNSDSAGVLTLPAAANDELAA